MDTNYSVSVWLILCFLRKHWSPGILPHCSPPGGGVGACFELQGLYSENINAGYWPNGNMLVTVLVTVEKLLP